MARRGRATAAGTAIRAGPPAKARIVSSGIHPSGATLKTPSSRDRSATSTADATSSRCTNCTGLVASSGRNPTPARAMPNGSASSWATTTVGRSTAAVDPGWSSLHSATSRSASAFSTAWASPGLGRNGTSSVNGTELPGHAPYTVALDTNTM